MKLFKNVRIISFLGSVIIYCLWGVTYNHVNAGCEDCLAWHFEPTTSTDLQAVKFVRDDEVLSLTSYTLLRGDDRISFIEVEPGIVAVATLSDKALYADIESQYTTPYEIFIALAGAQHDAPAFLSDHHQRQMALRDDRPSTPLSDAESLVIEQSSAQASYQKNLFGANCTFASDGAAFDDQWQSLGLPWHWYYSGTADYKSSPDAHTTWFRGHLCNYSTGSNEPRHKVWGGGWYISQAVPKGKRSLITIHADVKTFLRSNRYSHYYTESGWYRLGGMAR